MLWRQAVKNEDKKLMFGVNEEGEGCEKWNHMLGAKG